MNGGIFRFASPDPFRIPLFQRSPSSTDLAKIAESVANNVFKNDVDGDDEHGISHLDPLSAVADEDMNLQSKERAKHNLQVEHDLQIAIQFAADEQELIERMQQLTNCDESLINTVWKTFDRYGIVEAKALLQQPELSPTLAVAGTVKPNSQMPQVRNIYGHLGEDDTSSDADEADETNDGNRGHSARAQKHSASTGSGPKRSTKHHPPPQQSAAVGAPISESFWRQLFARISEAVHARGTTHVVALWHGLKDRVRNLVERAQGRDMTPASEASSKLRRKRAIQACRRRNAGKK